jgi:hypothetical protein
MVTTEVFGFGDGIEEMVAVDQAGQTLPDDVEERVERFEGRVLRIAPHIPSGSRHHFAITWLMSVSQ